MKFLKTKARLLLCGVIIAAFFIPAYKGVSGFNFVSLAFSEVGGHDEITSTDVLLAVIPLVLVPVSAMVILVASALHFSVRKTYLILPLVFMLFFFGILVLTARNNSGAFANPKVFFTMQPGFYLAGLAAVLLIYSKDNRRKKHRKKILPAEAMASA